MCVARTKFERGGTLQRLLEHGVDAIFRIAHGLVRASAKAVEHQAAVGGRSASRFHHFFCARAEVEHASLKFLLPQPFGCVCRSDHGLNAELAEALGQQETGGFFQVN